MYNITSVNTRKTKVYLAPNSSPMQLNDIPHKGLLA
jgi:hypothetical protein